MSLFGRIAPGYGGIMVFTVIHPFGYFGLSIASKGLPVKVTDKILCRASAERSTGIDIANQYPFCTVCSANGQFHEVRTLPYAILRAISMAEAALLRPVLQIGRGIYPHFLFQSGRQNKNPFTALLVPEHIRVAAFLVGGNDRIVFIDMESHSVIQTIRKALHLAGSRRSINGNHSSLSETCRIILIHHTATAEHSAQAVGLYGYRMMLPAYQVLAG